MDRRYAGFWRRLGAAVVDFAVYLPVGYMLIQLDGISRAASITAAILGQLIYYAYVLPLTARYGATLGKRALGIRVIPTDDGPLTWKHVWRRSAVDLVASTFIIVGTLAGHAAVPYAAYAAAPWHSRASVLEAAVPWYAWANSIYLTWIVSEFVVVLLNHRRRALHDFIAGTVVVVTRRHPAPVNVPPLTPAT